MMSTGEDGLWIRRYDWARIEAPSGQVYGGKAVEQHEDGTTTIKLGDMVPVRGKTLYYLPRNDNVKETSDAGN